MPTACHGEMSQLYITPRKLSLKRVLLVIVSQHSKAFNGLSCTDTCILLIQSSICANCIDPTLFLFMFFFMLLFVFLQLASKISNLWMISYCFLLWVQKFAQFVYFYNILLTANALQAHKFAIFEVRMFALRGFATLTFDPWPQDGATSYSFHFLYELYSYSYFY